MDKTGSPYSVLRSISLLKKGVQKRAVASLVILIFQGITEGVGLLMIIPLLAISGVGATEKSGSKLVQFVQSSFENAGLSVSIQLILIVYISIVVLYAFLKYFQSINTSIINQRVIIHWRYHFFRRLTQASWFSIKKIKISDLQNILSIEIRKLGSISNQLINITSSLILIAVYLFISILLSFKLTILAVLPLGILLLINRPINRKTHQLGKASVGHNLTMQSVIMEYLQSIKLVKGYRKEAEHIQEFENVNHELEEQSISYVKQNNKSKLLFEIIAAVIIAVYVYLAIVVFNTEATELILLIFIFVRLVPKVSKLTNNYQQVLNFLPAIQLTQSMIDQLKFERAKTEQNKVAISDFSTSIRFDEVTFKYDDRNILNQLSFIIPAQKTTVVLGSSGSGKSTIIDLIMGLLKTDDGKIWVDNLPLNELNEGDWKSLIAFVPQEAFLFHASIKENLLWAKPEATNDDIHLALQQAGASDLINQLPNGIETMVGDRGSQLSGGERQRIALARGLIRKPKILILDEATNAVDDNTENLIKQALSELNGKMTILIVAHRSSLIELADNTIELNSRES